MRWLLKGAGLVLFGVLLALGLFEVVLRLAGVGGPADLDPTYDRPNQGFVPHVDRQHPWSPAEGPLFKVAVIGDSFTTGYSNQWADSYGRRLELLLNLNAGAVPAEVGVFARNGTSTFQQLEFLDLALDWGAELIVLGLFLNDTEDHKDAELDARRQAMLPRVPTGFARRILQGSRALAWLYLRYEDIRRYRVALALQEDMFAPDYPGWKKFRQAIRRFGAVCSERDVRLVAVIWPSMGGLGPGYPHRIAHEWMARALKRAGIPYLDLLPEFEGKSSLRLAAYPDIDVHPNEVAHRIGATAIFEYLLESGQIDSSYKPAWNRVAGEGHYRKYVRRKRSPHYFPE